MRSFAAFPFRPTSKNYKAVYTCVQRALTSLWAVAQLWLLQRLSSSTYLLNEIPKVWRPSTFDLFCSLRDQYREISNTGFYLLRTTTRVIHSVLRLAITPPTRLTLRSHRATGQPSMVMNYRGRGAGLRYYPRRAPLLADVSNLPLSLQ